MCFVKEIIKIKEKLASMSLMFIKFTSLMTLLKVSWYWPFKEQNVFRAQVLEQMIFECTEIARWHCCNADNFKTVFDN